MPLSIQLIAIDIDGTLLDSHGKLPSPNQLAVHNALEAGIQGVVVTGRAFHHAQPIAKLLGQNVTLIAFFCNKNKLKLDSNAIGTSNFGNMPVCDLI